MAQLLAKYLTRPGIGYQCAGLAARTDTGRRKIIVWGAKGVQGAVPVPER